MNFYLVVTILVGGLIYFAFIDKKTSRVVRDTISFPFLASSNKQLAKEVEATVKELARNRAVVWPNIFAAINPGNDASIQKLLIEVRNGNQFNPFVGAGEIRTGFQEAIKKNPDASVVEALRCAVNSGNKIKHAGN